MTISEFIVLDEPAMKATVLHQGILVAKRRSKEHLVFLFQMDDYYVETYFTLRDKAATEYRAFNNLTCLEPYLESIAIDELLQ
jgi:hypothetical protein